jgi:hypothetical protein
MSIVIGTYQHFKGGFYDVICVARDEQFPDLEKVVYRSQKNGKVWIRSVRNFDEYVKEGKRFTLIKKLDTQRQLFAQTMRENRRYWWKAIEQNPAYAINGEGAYFKFILGDKISFALSVRIINRSEAQKLLDWVNKWSTKADALLDYKAYLRGLNDKTSEQLAP